MVVFGVIKHGCFITKIDIPFVMDIVFVLVK